MERRVALATAAAAAVTLGLGTVAFAAIGGTSVLGLADGGATKVVPGSQVQEIQNVVVVVSGSTTTVAGAPADATGAVVSPVAEPVTTTPAVVPVWTGAPTETTPAPAPTPTTAKSTTSSATPTTAKSTAPVTTAKPVTTTTAAPATTTPATNAPTTTAKPATNTTVRPPGVPADWPANKPIPPMPPNCQQPQLELNGVWNCDN